MSERSMSRRGFLTKTSQGALAASAAGGAAMAAESGSNSGTPGQKRGSQRLSLDRLQAWESLGYGMFIHYGMSTFVGKELPDGKAPASTYAPDQLDVDQWISVARDAGMKYAVLTTKHVAGHCLWPSKHTDYTVAHSGDKTNVVEAYVKACRRCGVMPGFYYCSWDNHHRFGSKTPSDGGWSQLMNSWPKAGDKMPPFTTSLYQTFQTAQITELLTDFGPIGEVWVDIPGVLGRGYRTFLYDHIAKLQPQTAVMMNSGISTGQEYNVDYAWPSDLIAIERRLPPASSHTKWRTIEGKDVYMPGEVCDPIGKEWFFVTGDKPRSDKELLEQYAACRQRGVNLLLDVPPDTHGRIPDEFVQALMRLRKNAKL
ncbi:MAG: alpha-L-fucosidase [Phycisphaerae bacterium]|nr:alpha-L-fucosidase [Phycisphaerae bacterium]